MWPSKSDRICLGELNTHQFVCTQMIQSSNLSCRFQRCSFSLVQGIFDENGDELL